MYRLIKSTLVFIVFLFFSHYLNAQDGNFGQLTTCQKMNMTLNSSTNLLKKYRINNSLSEINFVHPFTLDEVGGMGAIISSLKSDQNISFQYTKSEKSSLFDGYFHSYQQFYKGVKVEGSGFKLFTNTGDVNAIGGPPCPGCPPIEPCDQVEMFIPNIIEDIDVSVTPSFSENMISTKLNVSSENIKTVEKRLEYGKSLDCSIKLVYKVTYIDNIGESYIAKIDAHSGFVLFNSEAKLYKAAPLQNNTGFNNGYCVDLINEQTKGNQTWLKSDRIQVYEDNVPSNLDVWFLDDKTPKSPSSRNWNCILDVVSCNPTCEDAATGSYELYYNGDRVVEYLAANFGINIQNLKLAFNKSGTTSFVKIVDGSSNNTSEAFIIFGGKDQGYSTWTNFEIVAHEIAHVVLLDYFDWFTPNSAGLHEGLADIFSVFLQRKIDGGTDWVIGNGVFSPVRNLANTPYNCVANFTNETRHQRGEALGHWFYTLVAGNSSLGIKKVNQDELFQLLLEAIKSLNNREPDFRDLMRVTLDLAKKKYGPCSDQYKSIAKAWEKICVPTGLSFIQNPNEPCTKLYGDQVVCEEDNHFKICLGDAYMNTSIGSWTILGKYGTSFTSGSGMDGNAQYGGSCLHIVDIPEFPYYPQTITIVYNNNALSNSVSNTTLSFTVKIIDCDGDDPTCEEYHNSLPNSPDFLNTRTLYSNPNFEKEIISNENKLELIIYDLMGNVINRPLNEITENISGRPEILILTYYDNTGKIIKSKKILKL